ncbi:MAG: YjgN family protein [Myxococcaceae bacterium]
MESQTQAASPASTPPAQAVQRFSFDGDGTELFILVLKNVLLTLVTFGIYAAWAKTDRRRFLWRHTEIAGHRLSYWGTGGELFRGYLVVMATYALGILLIVLGQRLAPWAGVSAQLLFFLLIVLVVPLAIFRSRGYLLSRTGWRGLRFGLARDQERHYVKTFLLGNLLTVVTLGFYAPYLKNRLASILTRATHFGTQPFDYDGDGHDLFRIYVKGILLSLLTLGVYSFWMRAEVTRYQLAHTTVQGARGRSTVTGGLLFQLALLAIVGTTVSLGLAFPWIATYSLKTLLA